MEALGPAGEHFGRAFCVSPERQSLPLEHLTPEEQECIRRVGLGWERRVESALGASSSPTQHSNYTIRRNGMAVGTLSFSEGNVVLCLFERPCKAIGEGPDALSGARHALQELGFEVEPS